MASLAIDSSDIRSVLPADSAAAAGEPATPAPGRHGRLPILALAVAGTALLAGAGAAAYTALSGPSFLAGFAFAPGPAKPKRDTIRMGHVPDMPEIRNGVPEIIAGPAVTATLEPKSDPSPKPVVAVAIRPVVAAAEAAPPPPAPTRPTPVKAAVPATAAPAVLAKAEPIAPARLVEPTSTATITSAASLPVASVAARATPQPTTKAGSAAEVASASLLYPTLAASSTGPALRPSNEAASVAPRPAESPIVGAAVPIPPPAPPRIVAAAAARPERVASVQQPRVARAKVADGQPTSEPTKVAAADDDHIDVFGVAVPTIGATGRRIRDAVGALGDAVVSLPEKF